MCLNTNECVFWDLVSSSTGLRLSHSSLTGISHPWHDSISCDFFISRLTDWCSQSIWFMECTLKCSRQRYLTSEYDMLNVWSKLILIEGFCRASCPKIIPPGLTLLVNFVVHFLGVGIFQWSASFRKCLQETGRFLQQIHPCSDVLVKITERHLLCWVTDSHCI